MCGSRAVTWGAGPHLRVALDHAMHEVDLLERLLHRHAGGGTRGRGVLGRRHEHRPEPDTGAQRVPTFKSRQECDTDTRTEQRPQRSRRSSCLRGRPSLRCFGSSAWGFSREPGAGCPPTPPSRRRGMSVCKSRLVSHASERAFSDSRRTPRAAAQDTAWNLKRSAAQDTARHAVALRPVDVRALAGVRRGEGRNHVPQKTADFGDKESA